MWKLEGHNLTFEKSIDVNIDKIADVVIVDDDLLSLKIIHKNLTKLFPNLHIAALCSTAIEGIKIINEIRPQIIFMDIEMGTETGFEICEKINYSNRKIIYVSSFEKHIFKAFKCDASDFILKPIHYVDVFKAVNKVFSDIFQDYCLNEMNFKLKNFSEINKFKNNLNLDFIAIPEVDKIEFLKMDKILYLKADGRYTTFFLEDLTKIISSKNIGEYEKILFELPHFFRVHNSFIVNLTKVQNINKVAGNYCLMKNGELIPIAKRKLFSLSSLLRLK